MAIYVAQEAFKFFGTSYTAGATIDTTGWSRHQIDQLTTHYPVSLQGGAGPAGAPGAPGAAGTFLAAFRGAWSAATTYATGDLVVRNGTTYEAVAGSTNIDPEAAASPLADQTWVATTFINNGMQLMAQPFTVTAPISVSALTAYWVSGLPSAGTAGMRIGLATGIVAGQTYAGINWLAYNDFTADTVAGSGSAGVPTTYPLNTTTQLVPGTTYYFVVGFRQSWSYTNGAARIAATQTQPVLTGPWAWAGQGLIYGFSDTSFRADTGTWYMRFALLGPPVQWTKVAAKGDPGRGVDSPETVNSQAAVTGAYTVPDMATATAHRLTLTGNATLTFPAAAAGKSFSLALVQDGTGSRTVTWPANVKWPGGTAPTLTTAANKTDVISFVCYDGVNYLGFVSGQNF